MGKAAILIASIGVVFGCSSSSGSAIAGPLPPAGISLDTAGGALRVDWDDVNDALYYRIYWSTDPGVDQETDPSLVALTGPFVIPNVSGEYHVAISTVDAEGEGTLSSTLSVEVATGSPEKYFPTWALVEPSNVISFDYNFGLSSSQNASNLQGLINSLQPGDKVEIGSGTYSSNSAFTLNPQGTEEAPIWIVAKDGANPIITRPDNSQNTLNLGVGSPARYVCLRGLEIIGGDIAVRVNDCANVWMDQCEIHHCAQNAIAANTLPTSFLYFTRNEVYATAGTGEGFYIGGNFSNPVANNVVIAMNHVYDCGGSQGDGIEIKQGSWGCWIAENTVHDTNYPCILVYGTDGNPPNLVERNICWNSGDNVMQIQGEAIVRNNVAINGLTAFLTSDHQGQTRDLTVVNNTFINSGTATLLTSWGGRQGMLFANNAVYSQFGSSLAFSGGSGGVEVSGNVVFGPVSGVFSGFINGAGLGDFAGLSWDATARDITPVAMGTLDGAADAMHAALDELNGDLRVPPFDTGAAEAP